MNLQIRRLSIQRSLPAGLRGWSLVALVPAVVASMAIPSVAEVPSVLQAEPVPTVLRSTDPGWTEFVSGGDGSLEPEHGIGPGTRLQITFPDGTALGCTANFLWRDQTGELYLGTAGHCLLPEGATATHGSGADYDPSGVTTQAMTPGCVGHPTYALEPVFVCEDWVPLGDVVYATQGMVGTDFGLIAIPAQAMSLLRTAMPRWGGPYTVGTLSPGDQIFHYGHGLGTGTLFISRARTGIGLLTEDTLVKVYDSFAFAGLSAPGDSGSAVNAGLWDEEGNIASQRAIGVLTHSLPGTVYGTPIARAQALAGDAGLDITVVPVSD